MSRNLGVLIVALVVGVAGLAYGASAPDNSGAAYGLARTLGGFGMFVALVTTALIGIDLIRKSRD